MKFQKDFYKNIESNIERALNNKTSKGVLKFEKPKLAETIIIKICYDNITYLVEVILDDQKLLQIKTMWKKSTIKTSVH